MFIGYYWFISYMKFLVIGDLHGQMPLIPDVEFDAIIVPGDVCSDKGIKPLMLEAVRARSEGEEFLDWWDMVSEDEANVLLDDSLAAGRRVLELLDSLGVPVYAIPGNWDWTGYEEVSWSRLEKNLWEQEVVSNLTNVIDCDTALVELEGFSLIGYGRVNGPEKIDSRGYADVSVEEQKDSELDYEELLNMYSMMFEEAESPVVFLAHNVPYGTSIDTIEDENNPMDGMHYGSNLVRELVEKYQPLISIGGHIHEHYGTDMIGDTVCLNAGFGHDKSSLVEIVDGKVSVELLRS